MGGWLFFVAPLTTDPSCGEEEHPSAAATTNAANIQHAEEDGRRAHLSAHLANMARAQVVIDSSMRKTYSAGLSRQAR